MTTIRVLSVWALSLCVSVVTAAGEYQLGLLPPPQADPIFPVNYSGKWGFIDSQGKMLITPRFSSVGSFYDGLARANVRVEGQGRFRAGYIDVRGKWVIEPSFDEAGDFLEELAPARIGRKWGFIDREGHWVVEPQYQRVGEFHEGLACVHFWDALVEGPPQDERVSAADVAAEYAFEIHKDLWIDLASGARYRGSRFGYIDKRGAMVIPPREFDYVDRFSGGFAVVKQGAGWGFMDRKGRLAFFGLFDSVSRFSEGLAVARVGEKYGYIDQTGKWVIAPRFSLAAEFCGGLAAASDNPEVLRGVIDRTGNYVVKPRFGTVGRFSEGLAVAYLRGMGTVFINRSGEEVPLTTLRVENGFSNGMAIVGQRGKRVYMNRKGEIIAPFEKNP